MTNNFRKNNNVTITGKFMNTNKIKLHYKKNSLNKIYNWIKIKMTIKI